MIKNFKNNKLKHKLDKQFCKENNILLLRIPYNKDKVKLINGLRDNLNDKFKIFTK